MAKSREFPTPKKRFHKNAWELYWNWGNARFVIHPGIIGREKEGTAEFELRRLATILASQNPDFPDEWAHLPAVRRYIGARYGVEAPEDEPKADLSVHRWLVDYEPNLLASVGEDWAATSMSVLRRLQAFIPGGLGKVTHGLAIQYLDSLVEKGGKAKEDAKSKGLSSGTRNRHLAICRRFFKWCVSTKRLRENPFAGIDNLKEEDIEGIIYCTKEERDRILAVARGLGRKDWIAIPIAFYAGCRREEIFRLQWEDVNMESKRLIIRKSKTGERRTTPPLAKELIPLLDGLKKAHGPVVELPDDKTWENHADRLVELVRERLCRPLNPDEKGNPSEVVGKRVFLYTPAEVRGVQGKIASMKRSLARTKHPKKAVELAATLDKWRKCPTVAHDGGEWLPAERVRWNAWRHTFASLRVQAGVSIDKVSSWMGNSPEVCRKHYA